jgi:hypothetical protein
LDVRSFDHHPFCRESYPNAEKLQSLIRQEETLSRLHQGWLVQTQQLQQQRQQQQQPQHQPPQQQELQPQGQPFFDSFHSRLNLGSQTSAASPSNDLSQQSPLPLPPQQIGSPNNHPESVNAREASQTQNAQLTMLEMTQVPDM